MSEVRDRLDGLRSFILWTAPLYVVFVGTGLYETHFTFTLALAVLIAVLAAFGVLDGLILANLQVIRSQIASQPEELPSVRARLERLARTVVYGGAAFGAAGVISVVLLAL